ncbi:MAG TPA: phosphoribosyltransferase family protein [Rhizomicrobium sp.]|nr:phosphoribosyltransferase family protein [Rhizomicrobium sp.]
MTGGNAPAVLFSEAEIRARVAAMAADIARLDDPPDLAIPILIGGFVFAADLLRALDSHGASLAVEFLRLRSYANARVAGSEVSVLLVPDVAIAGRHALIIDGVLDQGHTLKRARELVLAAGARAAVTAVVVDKCRDAALARADFAAFTGVQAFIVGYGMDDAGLFRSLPYIAAAETARRP